MPTGYTDRIEKGMQFPEFIRVCARGFGALIMMRDDPIDAPFPEEIKPDTEYYDKSLAKSQAELKKLQKMSSEDIAAAAKKDYDDAIASYQKYINEGKELLQKYSKVLADVYKWKPPTPDHERLKSFMIEQLTTSIEHDCNNSYYEDRVKEYKQLSPQEWHKQEIQRVKENIAYSKKHIKEEIETAKKRTEWIQALAKSVPPLENPVLLKK